MIKKKPNFLVVISSVLCLLGAFILTGMINSGFSLGIGEILCALAGVLYGVNIAVTGVYAKKLIASIYVFIHMCVQIVVSLITAIALNNIIVNGAPLEAIKFSWEITDLLIILVSGIFFSAVCWVIRTNVMKYVSATAVAIIMPFSAVVTGVVSVIIGKDPFTLNLVFGAIIGLVAAILSGIGDVKDDKKQKVKATTAEEPTQEQ
jgi:drug/metabolite transporter (DMT)-like permease